MLWPKTTIVDMNTRALHIPTEASGPVFTSTAAQSSAQSETTPTLRQTTLTTYTIAAWTGVNQSLIEDSNVALAQFFSTTATREAP